MTIEDIEVLILFCIGVSGLIGIILENKINSVNKKLDRILALLEKDANKEPEGR